MVVGLTPPRQNIEEWNKMAALVRRAASHTFEEGFMGKTVPTINQIVMEAEVILARFSRVLQPEERQAGRVAQSGRDPAGIPARQCQGRRQRAATLKKFPPVHSPRRRYV